jgi:hypothetical protein
MIPDRCGNAPPRAPRNSSGEIAADRVLHVQRFALPLRVITVAQPRLGRHPRPAAVLTSEHHPPPAPDDMAERPQIPGRPTHIQRLVQVLVEPGPVGVRQGGTDRLNPLDSSGPTARSAPLTPWLPASRPLFRSGVGQSLLGRACMPSSPPLGRPSSSDWSYRKQTAASPTVIPPESWPNTIQHWMTGRTARPMLHPRCIAVLDDYGVERKANGEASSVMAMPADQRELFVMEWDGCGPGLDVVEIVDSRSAGCSVGRFARERPADQRA